jgi:hypothetical protein
MKESHWKRCFTVVVLLYVVSFFFVADWGTWSTGYIATTGPIRTALSEGVPPVIICFSENRTLNRILYWFYWPIHKPLEWFGIAKAFEDVTFN